MRLVPADVEKALVSDIWVLVHDLGEDDNGKYWDMEF